MSNGIAIFTINWRQDVTPAHVARFKGVLYDICRVDVYEGYKRDITLYCRLKKNTAPILR